MPYIDVTLEVSNFVIFKEFNEDNSQNMKSIFITFEVSKLDTSNNIKDEL
jgi:hypothetical protein